MVFQGSFDYCEDTLQTLYARHKVSGADHFDHYESFRHSIINFLDDSYNFLFGSFLQIDRFKNDFMDMLDDEDAALMAGMADFLGIDRNDYDFGDVAYAPDICLERDESGCIIVTTFDPNSNYIFDLTDWAFTHFCDNFTLEEFQNLGEDEQDLFIKLFHLHGTDGMSESAQEEMHKRMVFGLHIPQDLKDYHDECAKELALRIMTSPILSDTLETFLNRKKRVDDSQLYFQDEKDKRFFASLLMAEMADIWQTPRPIEEELDCPPEKDKAGKEFSTFMTATFRHRSEGSEQNNQTGLIYKINANGGYLTEANENFYTVESLAHEFGHLVSNFSVHGQGHGPWLEDEMLTELLSASPIMQIEGARDRFWQNSTANIYYGATETDFSGLQGIKGKHVYSGQYEERHANYVGDVVRKMTEFALNNKKTIRNFDRAKQNLQFVLAKMMTQHQLHTLNEDTYLGVQQHILNTSNFGELHQACDEVILDLAAWIEDSICEEKQIQNPLFANAREPIIADSALKFANDLEDFTLYVQMFFEMRGRVLDMDHKPVHKQEISLSCA